jgi:hypothetical protein
MFRKGMKGIFGGGGGYGAKFVPEDVVGGGVVPRAEGVGVGEAAHDDDVFNLMAVLF